MELIEYLQEECDLKAKKPVDHNLLSQLPFFNEVFSEEELKSITKISGNGGIALIERKRFKAGGKIIEKGNYDQMLYWVLGGTADVLAYVDEQEKPKKVFTFHEGGCLGESVITGEERKSDIVAGKDGAEVIEIDFSIVEVCHELGARIYQLIALTLCMKLKDSYSQEMKIINKATKKLKELHEKNKQLKAENDSLRK